jgi:hypothetical protein
VLEFGICLLMRRLNTLKNFKFRRSRAGGNPVAYDVKSLGPSLRWDDEMSAAIHPDFSASRYFEGVTSIVIGARLVVVAGATGCLSP